MCSSFLLLYREIWRTIFLHPWITGEPCPRCNDQIFLNAQLDVVWWEPALLWSVLPAVVFPNASHLHIDRVLAAWEFHLLLHCDNPLFAKCCYLYGTLTVHSAQCFPSKWWVLAMRSTHDKRPTKSKRKQNKSRTAWVCDISRGSCIKCACGSGLLWRWL